jgi:HTH-like domain
MAAWLATQGHRVNRKRVQRLMRLLGLAAIYQRPNTSKPAAAHKIYPYLLRGLAIERVNQSLPSRKRGVGAWTTSLSSGCGAASNTRRSTSTLMRQWPKPRAALQPGWTFTTRQHQSLGHCTPRQIYQEGLWICGRSAFADRLRASSEGGEMLTFAHIPTGTTVNKAIDIDASKSSGVAPATAPTMIGADIETGGASP